MPILRCKGDVAGKLAMPSFPATSPLHLLSAAGALRGGLFGGNSKMLIYFGTTTTIRVQLSSNTSSKGADTVNSPIELRKVIWGAVLSLLWVFTFLFINGNLVIDWTGTGNSLTPLKPLVI